MGFVGRIESLAPGVQKTTSVFAGASLDRSDEESGALVVWRRMSVCGLVVYRWHGYGSAKSQRPRRRSFTECQNGGISFLVSARFDVAA
jgi:hypothetical protein